MFTDGAYRTFLHDRHFKAASKPAQPSVKALAASGLRLPDDGAKRGRRTDPSEGYAGDPDNAGEMRRLDARAVGRSQGDATTVVGRCADRRARHG